MYLDANHIQHVSHEAACIYYGADTPADIAAELASDMADALATIPGEEMVCNARWAGDIAPYDPVADWNPWG